MTLTVEGMWGLGDNIYQLPIIKELARREKDPVYLRTPWPDLYVGIENLHFIRAYTRLRTQSKNADRFVGWDTPPVGKALKLTYVRDQNRGIPLWRGLVNSSGLRDDFKYHLSFNLMPIPRANYAVIRPVTIRKEWAARSRNPDPMYIQATIDHLNLRGVRSIVVADVDPPAEEFDGPIPNGAERYFIHGEKKPQDLVDMFRTAKLVVGPVGWLAPMAMATGTPSVVIHGGAGGWNAPQILDAPCERKPIHVLPENYCRCRSHTHACDKRIDLCKLKQAIDQALA